MDSPQSLHLPFSESDRRAGLSEIRLDAWEKVSGQARYVDDLAVPGLLTGLVFRSSHHHALILSLDLSEAEKVEGVISVLTSKDIPGSKIVGDIIQDRPVLAIDKVRFIGEPIAVIVAQDLDSAERARNAIQIEYEPLQPLFDPMEALQENAPPIHPNGNLCSATEAENGNIIAGFAQSDLILEETFRVPRIYPGYLEPETNLAIWKEPGQLEVWVSSQKPFSDRTAICQVLALPEDDVMVRSAAVGGAFGGKEDSSLALLAALAAWKTRTSVKISNTREESILAHPKRHPAVLQYKIGAKKDGTLMALHARVFMDTGAYASYGPAVAQLLTETVTGPYRIPNVKAETCLCYTNSPISGAMRGFGSPQTNFAYESMIELLADKLAMDSSSFRRKNIWRKGDKSYTRVRVNQPESIEACLDIAQAECAQLERIPSSPGKLAGVGYALAFQTMGLGRGVPDDSTNQLEWLPDGRILLRVGAPDLGQGLFTAAAQITAEALGVDLSQVMVENIDTSKSPDGGVTCASRMTYMVGNSLQKAAAQAVQTLLEETAHLLQTDSHQLCYHQGTVQRIDQPGAPVIPVAEIISRLAESEKKIQVNNTFSFPYGSEVPDHLPVGMPHVLFCFGAQAARVEVDPLTGKVEVTHISAIHDVGKAINRNMVEGQIEGGVATGIGYALTEEVALKTNHQWVNDFTEYLIPTSMDVPQHIKSIILEYPEPTGPGGVKGIGEITLVPTAAAISQAVYKAVGVRTKSLPIKAEKVIQQTVPGADR